MAKQPIIERIELTVYQYAVENLRGVGFGYDMAYQKGPGSPFTKFAIRIFTDAGVTGEYVPHWVGNPISLAVVQIELAQRLGVPLQGVSFPGHFLVRLPLDEGIIVLDPFQKGRSLDAAELRQRARSHLDTHEIDDHHLARMLEPASHRAILARMLRNLKGVYAEREQWEKALRCCDRLLTLDSHQPEEYRDRGSCYLKVGHLRAAREDLRKYLGLMPQADDADSVSLQLAELGAGLPRLN